MVKLFLFLFSFPFLLLSTADSAINLTKENCMYRIYIFCIQNNTSNFYARNVK